MASANRDKIDDVGEVLPYARKHEDNSREFDTSAAEVTLKELWPEPDWEAEIASGMDEYVAAHLAMIYAGLRKKPRTQNGYWSEISNERWLQAYIDGLAILRSLFDQCFDSDDVDQINSRFAQQLGYSGLKALQKVSLKDCLPYWAIGRGERVLKHPTSMSPLGRYIADYLPDLGWPESDIALKVGRFPLEFTDGTFGVGWLAGKSARYRESEVCDTLDEALDLILELHKEEQAKADTPDLKVPKKPSCRNLPRTGPDHREGDVPPEEILETFRFRGVQFGASMGEKEKQRWVNAIYDALSDLSIALGIPRSWQGLGGMGIAFGARGSGNAYAHYEPELRIINLTREKGASSLSHEWGHGFDHRLSNSMEGNVGFASLGAVRACHTSNEAMKPAISALRKLMIQLCDRSSGFYKRSLRVQGIKGARKYWTTEHELFARAFESFVQDTLLAKNITNPWLVHGTRPEDYHRFVEETFVYPLGDERERFNEGFAALFSQISTLTRYNK